MKRHTAALTAVSTIIAGLVLALIFTRSPRIPSTISDEEYGVYSDWTRSHFAKNPPQGALYVLSRPFKFNPTEQNGSCRQLRADKARDPASLTRKLADLGDAEYPFGRHLPADLRLPWKYALIDAPPGLEPGAFHLVAFSRVAFNWDHKEALFAASDACAAGECGSGGAVYAYKEHGRWLFKATIACLKYSTGTLSSVGVDC